MVFRFVSMEILTITFPEQCSIIGGVIGVLTFFGIKDAKTLFKLTSKAVAFAKGLFKSKLFWLTFHTWFVIHTIKSNFNRVLKRK